MNFCRPAKDLEYDFFNTNGILRIDVTTSELVAMITPISSKKIELLKEEVVTYCDESPDDDFDKALAKYPSFK